MTATITFLLGAGASIKAGIPHVYQFYSDFKEYLAENFGPAHPLSKELLNIEQAWQQETKSKLGDLERFYELLTFINADTTPPSIPLGLPPWFPKRSREIELLEWELKKYVQQRCLDVHRSQLDYLSPILDFAKLSRPLAILSLNYDPCIEIILDDAKASWSDGTPPDDVEFFASALKFPENKDVHLIKLHGSATWYQTRLDAEPGWMRRVRAKGQVEVGRKVGAARTQTHEAMMIYPTLNKALTNGPFPSLTVAAEHALAKSKLCIAIGYSFGDVHIRRLVLEALSSNRDLKLVLVNPRASEVLPVLYREASLALHDRIGMVPEPEIFGKVETALEEGWLLKRSHEWLSGTPLLQPFASSRGKRGGSDTPIPSRSSWELRYPIKGGVAGLARWENYLYLVLNSQQAIGELDMRAGKLRILAGGFQNLRGLAFDPAANMLFVVSNKYQSWLPGAPWSRGGIGQIWAIDVASGVKLPATRINWPRTLLEFAIHREKGQEAPWKRLVGGLRWPTSVVVEEPGRSLLFTEARALRRLSFNTRKISTPLDLPLPFNVVGLAWVDPNTVLIADAGVHPNGFGRLMRGYINTPTVEILADGWRGIGSIAFLPEQRLALLVQIGSWPRGRVFSLNVDAPGQGSQHVWTGLNGPSHCSYSQAEGQILVSTREGVVELRLD